jgi:hypothetical protein
MGRAPGEFIKIIKKGFENNNPKKERAPKTACALSSDPF